ncbi:MAG: phosphoglycerate kinase [Euryarchaeota archaeon]|nr:phosphoglycerate kinase [Euryarchaeota archaeon]
MKYLTMDDFNLRGKTVFVRVDVNSPIDPVSGTILDYSRFRAHRRTLLELRNSRVVILAHQSRPGKRDYVSLKSHARVFTNVLGTRVKFVEDLFGEQARNYISNLNPGEYLLLENTRFYAEEYCLKKGNFESTNIVKNLAPYGDYFINDAFAAAHRAQPTLVGFAKKMPMLAGRLMEREITMLTKFINMKARPKLAIFGGAKAEDSIKVTESFLDREIVDKVLTGGVVSYFFLIAKGYELGEKSIEFLRREFDNYEELVKKAKKLLNEYEEKIEIPVDVVVNDSGRRKGMPVTELPDPNPIYDIGLDTAIKYAHMAKEAKGIILNGPMGVFEIPAFSIGTLEVLRGVAESPAFKVAGGGHTIAAIEKYHLSDKFDHVSTGGGSLISFLSGQKMPVLEAFEDSYNLFHP